MADNGVTPRIEGQADPELVALVDAARVMVDNGRQGPSCYYIHSFVSLKHDLGSNDHCALCCLSRALEPYRE